MGSRHGRAGSGRHVIARSLLVAMTALAVDAAAAESSPKVDAELLEFLGSIDVEEEGWQEYLEQKPVKPVAKAPEKTAPAAAKPDTRQVKEK
jgi:hypothetical protein